MEFNARLLTAGLAALIAGCSSIGGGAPGIDATKPMTDPLSSSFATASTAQSTAANDTRANDRRAQVRAHLAEPTGAESAYADVQCSGYNVVRNQRARARSFGAAHDSLETITGPSPDTIVGLTAAIAQRPRMEGQQQSLSPTDERNFFNLCNTDASNADFAFPASVRSARQETAAATALLNFIDVFKSVVRPVIVNGLTLIDRRRRLEALEDWANDTQNGLPALESQLRIAANQQAISVSQQRLVAAAEARQAWLAVVEARADVKDEDGRPIAECAPEPRTAPVGVNQHGEIEMATVTFRDSECVLGLQEQLSEELDAFYEAAHAYDTAFDSDPTEAYRATSHAASELRRWLRGELLPDEAAAVRAASLAAAVEWLGVISSAEQLSDDAETRNKLREAEDELREALGLRQRHRSEAPAEPAPED